MENIIIDSFSIFCIYLDKIGFPPTMRWKKKGFILFLAGFEKRHFFGEKDAEEGLLLPFSF